MGGSPMSAAKRSASEERASPAARASALERPRLARARRAARRAPGPRAGRAGRPASPSGPAAAPPRVGAPAPRTSAPPDAAEHALPARRRAPRLRLGDLDEAGEPARAAGRRGRSPRSTRGSAPSSGLNGRASHPKKPHTTSTSAGPGSELHAGTGASRPAASGTSARSGVARRPGALESTCGSPCGKQMTSPASSSERRLPDDPGQAAPARDRVELDDVVRARHHLVGDGGGGGRLGHPRRGALDAEEDRAGEPDRGEDVGQRIGAHRTSVPGRPGERPRPPGRPRRVADGGATNTARRAGSRRRHSPGSGAAVTPPDLEENDHGRPHFRHPRPGAFRRPARRPRLRGHQGQAAVDLERRRLRRHRHHPADRRRDALRGRRRVRRRARARRRVRERQRRAGGGPPLRDRDGHRLRADRCSTGPARAPPRKGSRSSSARRTPRRCRSTTAAFDVVLSTFGVMFAPDQPRAARELLRVCRPGGRIALANWTPDGFIGKVFQVVGAHVPPPPGLRPPSAWGTEQRLDELFGEEARELRTRRRDFVFRYRSPAHWLEVFRTWYGPIHRAFLALAARGAAGARARSHRAARGAERRDRRHALRPGYLPRGPD